jgi:hypothetical protein
MQGKFSVCLILILFLSMYQNQLTAQVVVICDGESTTVMEGEYNVMNNVWGASTAQCLEVDLDSTYFRVSLSDHNNGNEVAAYPSIFKGCHWGWCTTKSNQMPLQVKYIESAPFIWVINTSGITGTWNAALDIWFAESAASWGDYSAELMIWLDYHGNAAPAGSKKATVEIGGLIWDVYFAAWSSWNYIAYKVNNPVDSVSLDLRDFIHDSITRGYIYTPWYMHAIEAGYEIFSDGEGLTTHSFATDVIETDNPLNYAPSSFRIQSPPDGGTVDSMVVTFKWQVSPDPDLDSIEYILYLSGPDADTTITRLSENNFVFDGKNFLKSNTTYTWYVEATDKIDTTMSTTKRTFNTPTAIEINSVTQFPNNFLLYQNYPNPFNSSTKIVFEIQAATVLDLSVYNLLGQKVKTLKTGNHPPGKYQITFDASELPAGIYYYELRNPYKNLKRKCLYLK